MNKTGFKLCFSTLPCMDYTSEQLKKLCDDFKFDGVEVRLTESTDFNFVDGLNVVDIGTSVNFKRYDEAQIKSAKEILDKIKDTDIKAIRVFLGNFAVMTTYAKEELSYDGIVKALQEISDYTDKEIWVETHNEFSSGRVLKKLMEDTDRENVKIIWDIIHPVEEFETPEETWEYIGKKVAHVHVKDGKRSENPFKHEYDYTALGEGALPIKEIFCILKKNNYDGYISLEWENAWRPELRKYSMDINDILSGFIEFVNQCV